MEERFALFGDIIHSERNRTLKEFRDSYLVIRNGRVEKITKERPEGVEVHDYRGMLIIPGLIDMHLHAPQYQYAGLFMDEELLDWLNHHTFPEEGKYADIEYAERAYGIFTEDIVKSETTRFSLFATIHEDSSLLLARMLEDSGLAGYIGKVNMDRNSPDYLKEDTSESIRRTLSFIEEMKDFKNVMPIITPRFIPSCSNRLLEALSNISRERHIPVQSHLDENLSEIEWVRELVPESRNYADAYAHFHLLGEEKTIMAHVVWPGEDEYPLLKNKNVFVAHSPSSNSNLSSGIAPIRKMLEAGINIGLATDLAGGSSMSMLKMLTHAIEVSKLYYRLKDESAQPLTFREAFYIATRMAGTFFGKVGAFDEDFDADVIVLDTSSIHTTLYDELSLSERLELYSYRASGRPVKAKFVKGRKVL